MNFQTEQLKIKWQQKGFQQPTAIQAKTAPIIQAKSDLVAISPTGTGKTLAYLLPLLDRIDANRALQLLVIAPSQELAQQIGQVAQEWVEGLALTVQVLAGGANQKRQIEKLKAKPEIIIGTVGRLLELSTLKKLKLHQLQTIVIDEADYLLQPSSLTSLRELIKKAPSQRQLLFFSATSSDELQQVSHWFNVQPQYITVTPQELPQGSTTHSYIIVPQRKRSDELRRIAYIPNMRALVFVKGRIEADTIAEKMAFHHIPIAVLHSEQTATERKEAIEQFKKFAVQFLVVTDVAARGLDIKELPAVIHYDLPIDEKTYQHRSGRTGRMGNKGLVLSLVNERELRNLKKLVSQPLLQLYTYEGQLVTELPQRPVQKQARRSKTVRNQALATKQVKRVQLKKEKSRKKNVLIIKRSAN